MAISRPLKGILLTCAAVLVFASLDSLSKYLTTFNSVLFQEPAGFMANCAECRTERYLQYQNESPRLS